MIGDRSVRKRLTDKVSGLWSKSKRSLFVCCLVSLILLDFILRLPSPLISDFLFAQWLFSYDRGFIRRGLIGQICQTALGSLCYTKSLIEHLALSANLLYVLLLLALLWRLVRNKISIGVLIFCFVLATYTGGIQFLSHDMGRFDIFLNLFVILYYFIITSKVSESISVVIAVVFSIIGVLIHEIFVFVSFPMIIGLYVLQYHNRQSKALLSIALMATPVITVCILMALLTNLSQADVQAYYNYLLSKSGFVDTSPSSAINGFFSSVKSLSAGWLAISPERLFSREGFNRFSSGLVVVWPVIIYYFIFWKKIWSDVPIAPILKLVIAGSSLGGFLLFPIALDYGRWFAWVTWNMLLIIAFMRLRYGSETDKYLSSSVSCGMMLFILAWTSTVGPLDLWDGAPGNVRALFKLE